MLVHNRKWQKAQTRDLRRNTFHIHPAQPWGHAFHLQTHKLLLPQLLPAFLSLVPPPSCGLCPFPPGISFLCCG